MTDRKARASAHAARTWICPICGEVVRGNGGRAAHQRMHIKDAGIDPRDFTQTRDQSAHRQAWRAALAKLQKEESP